MSKSIDEIVKKYNKCGVKIPDSFFENDVVQMIDSENKYSYNNKKYIFQGFMFNPSISMVNIDDNSDTISFDITSDCKNDFELI